MATKQRIPVLTAIFTEFQEEFENLSTEDTRWVIMNTKEAIALCISAITNRVKAAAQTIVALLGEIIATAVIPATTEKFITKDKFKVDTSKKAKVNISYLGDNFKSWFLGKVENPFPGSTLYGRQLNQNSVDGPILAELGGQEKAETSLNEIYAMMESQPNGESGDLLNNGWANIFYVMDISGTLRAVSVYWNDDGWHVYASSVEGPGEWNAGGRVFSRNSLVPQNA